MSTSENDIKNEIELRKKLLAIARKCFEFGLIAGTWGNLSVRVADDKILITPSGFEKTALEPEHLLLIDLDGNLLKGVLKPSIETWMHVAIYKTRNDINAIIHTHSPYAVLFASLNEPIPAISVDFASMIGHEVPITKYAPPGSKELAENLVEVLRPNRVVALIRNHGAVAIGRNLEEAFQAALLLEQEAELYFRLKLLGKADDAKLPADEVNRLHSAFIKAYGQKRKKITLRLK